MRGTLIRAGILLGMVTLLNGCTLIYQDTYPAAEGQDQVTETGLIAFPPGFARDTGFRGLVPLYRETQPVQTPDF